MCHSQRWNADTDTDGHSDTDSNGDAYCYRGAEVYSFTATASHTSAKTVEIFATSTIFNVPRRSVVRRRVTGDRCFSWPARTEWRTLPTHANARLLVGRAVLCTPISQNSVDTFLRIQVQKRTTVAMPYSIATKAPLSPQIIQ